MGTTPSVGSPDAEASSMRPPGISVAAKWTLPPGTLSQGESICRKAASALREFIFGASGHFCTTKEETSWSTAGPCFGAGGSAGFVRAHEAVNENPRIAQTEALALTSPPPAESTDPDGKT
jgi:hypothetical protein